LNRDYSENDLSNPEKLLTQPETTKIEDFCVPKIQRIFEHLPVYPETFRFFLAKAYQESLTRI